MRKGFPSGPGKLDLRREPVHALLAIMSTKTEFSPQLPDRYVNADCQFVVLYVRFARIARIEQTTSHSVSYTWNRISCPLNPRMLVRAYSPPASHQPEANRGSLPTLVAMGPSP